MARMLAPRSASTVLASLLVLSVSLPPARGAETVIEEFPVLVRAGLAGTPEGPDPDGRILLDLPFSTERGYGYVGGRPDRLAGAVVFGGKRHWIPALREDVEKYIFRLPRGEYFVELSFIETELAMPGMRVFDVVAEEKLLFPRVDIAAKVGDFTWLTLAGVVSVFDGWLDLRFVRIAGTPRVSRLRLSRMPAAQAPPPVPRMKCRGSAGQNILQWDMPEVPGIRGFGIFRSDSEQGPFESLTEEPVHGTSFLDSTVAPLKEYFYKICAYDLQGRQSAFSEPLRATARQLSDLGLKIYELNVSEDNLRRLLVRANPEAVVPAELRHLGAVYYVYLRCPTDRRSWQRKKSFLVELDRDRNRRFQRRQALFLSAEASDSTFLRERLSAEVAQTLGLPSPAAEPVLLLLNGKCAGVYFDIEVLDRAFRERARLDRVGLLALKTRDDMLATDWSPYGEQVGEEGSLVGLNRLMHELNRLGEGEMERFFQEGFYLDRLVDRLSFCVLRGEADRDAVLRYFLKDSRNGKWEILQDRHRSGDWGIFDFDAASHPVTDADARRMLLGSSLTAGGFRGGANAVLESRFFNQPDLKRRFLARVEALLSKEMPPEKLDALVDKLFEQLKGAVLEDPALRLCEGAEEAFLSGPGRIKSDHRARCEALMRVLSRGPPPSPAIVLHEVLLAPADGDPWVEIRNSSPTPVQLRGCFLSNVFGASLQAGAVFALPEGDLPPGGMTVVKIPAGQGFSLSPTGGFLGLLRKSERGSRSDELLDFLFFGRQTKGVSYGRLPARDFPGSGDSIDARRWAYLAEATPGEENSDRELLPPPHEFRQGLSKETSGAISVWFKTSAADGGSAASKPLKVNFRCRGEGAEDFGTTELAWDEKSFTYTFRFEVPPARTRIPYYFVAVSEDGIERSYPLAAPDLTFYVPVLPEVKINEVLPRPLRTPSSAGEFIELYNPSQAPVDLGGYYLSDARRNSTRWRIPEGCTVPPRGFIVFYGDGLNREKHTSFKLSNSGEFLGLFGRMEEGNLLVDSLAYRGMRTGESWGASPDGSKSFRAWKDPTPGAKNIPKIPEEYLKKRREGDAQPEESREPDPKEKPPEEE